MQPTCVHVCLWQLAHALNALMLPTDKPAARHPPQLLAPDMPLMVAEFLRERNTLLRGLAHPIAVGGPGRADGGGAGAGTFGAFLKTFGAVPVTGNNLYRLLSQGESVLL